jgi:hypothetical protein
LAAWLTLWTFIDWRKRQRFFWGLSLTGATLVLGGELVLPGWIGKFRAGITAYQTYTHAESVIQTLTAPTVGAIINWVVLLLIAVICWRTRKVAATSDTFVSVSALVLATTVVVVPSLSIYNHILLFPAIFVIAGNWTALWSTNVLNRLVALIMGCSLAWPWLTSAALLGATLFVPLGTLQKAWSVPLFSSLAIPVSVLALFGLHVRRAL